MSHARSLSGYGFLFGSLRKEIRHVQSGHLCFWGLLGGWDVVPMGIDPIRNCLGADFQSSADASLAAPFGVHADGYHAHFQCISSRLRFRRIDPMTLSASIPLTPGRVETRSTLFLR